MPKNGYEGKKNKKKPKVMTHTEFYNSTKWAKCKRIIKEANPCVCLKCGTTNKISVDHIIPKTKDLTKIFDLDNLQILCGRCNKEKYLLEDDYRTDEYKKRLRKYLKRNRICKKEFRNSIVIKALIFEHNQEKPKRKPKKKKPRFIREKIKQEKRDRVSRVMSYNLRKSGFKDPELDIGKILELQSSNT